MNCRKSIVWLALGVVPVFSGCQRASTVTHAAPMVEQSAPRRTPQIRAMGTVQAANSITVLVPQLAGQGGGRFTLTDLIPNGSKVKAGDTVAEFDNIQQLDNARDTQAKYDDLGHQVEQRKAEYSSNAEKRRSDLQKAEADLSKAKLQLRRGPLLSEIDRLKNETKAADAEARVASLNRANHSRDVAEAAALRVLELQRDRQKVSLERALNNAARLIVKAPLSGMVALESIWRNNSLGKPQEGDQLFTGQPLVRIFDPSRMVVDAVVGEPDGAVLVPGKKAKVRLDAYSELVFDAEFLSASPVAASALGVPIKTFAARFRLIQSDPHLLPDLSAAVILEGHGAR